MEALERREDLCRLFVYQRGKLLEETDSVGVDRVDRLTGTVQEFHFRRIVFLCERIDLELLHQRYGLIGFAVDFETANEVGDTVGRGSNDKVAFRHCSLIAGWKKKILAALSF